MITALFSDLHGQVSSLRKLLEHARAELIVSLGDVLGNGPNSECLELMRSHRIPAVTGNHEVDLWAIYEKNLSTADELFIKSWPTCLLDGDALLAHASLKPLAGGGYRFARLKTAGDAREMFESAQFRVAFVGHSHQPGWWTSATGQPLWTPATVGRRLEFEQAHRYIVDVGSLGEPKRSDDPTWVAWDREGVTWRSLCDERAD